MTAREKRLAEGICIWCGKAPARENRQMCEQCGGPLRDAEGKIPMYETKDGLREYTICEKCRKRAREYEKKRRK